MAEEESSNASSDELSSETSEEYRSIKVCYLNVSAPPPSAAGILELTKNVTYSDFSNQICRRLGRAEGALTLLAPTFGPRPCWKFPEDGTRIPHNVTILYLVDRTKSFVIALLRTDTDDEPLLVESPDDENVTRRTARSVIESVISSRNLDLKAAKMYGNLEELKDQVYDYSAYQALPSFPTVFYASSAQSDTDFMFKWKPETQKPISMPFRELRATSERLLQSMLDCSCMVAPCLHLARSLLHLAISLIDADEDGRDKLVIGHQLQEIVDEFEAITDNLIASTLAQIDILQAREKLDAIFQACCQDLPGAVTIRMSYHSYQRKIRYEIYDRGYRQEHTGGGSTNFGSLPVSGHSEIEGTSSASQNLQQTEQPAEVNVPTSSEAPASVPTTETIARTSTTLQERRRRRLNDAIDNATTAAQSLVDAGDSTPVLAPLKESMIIIMSLASSLRNIERYEEEWEVFANRLADRVDMVHEEVVDRTPNIALESDLSSLEELLGPVVREVTVLRRAPAVSGGSSSSGREQISDAVQGVDRVFDALMTKIQRDVPNPVAAMPIGGGGSLEGPSAGDQPEEPVEEDSTYTEESDEVEATSERGELRPLQGLNEPAYQQPISATPAFPSNVGVEAGVEVGVAEQTKPEQIYRCPDPDCGKEFRREYLLQFHVREHDTVPFLCTRPGCGVRFTTPMEQRAHEEIHQIQETGHVPNLPPLSQPVVSQPLTSRPSILALSRGREREFQPNK